MLMRWSKYTNNHPRIGGKTMKLLSCSKEKMQIALPKLIEIFCLHLFQGNRFIHVTAHAIPVKLPALPIQNLHRAFTPVSIAELIGECIRQLGNELECLAP